ncbi:MAG: hypothetical protein AUK37_00330 [Rhodobacterales bacterium CG2_30_65_12]|nr:MAG: hypothetical protein AUK37_00330 [Rhodobacterales bacterium CG2_30_65_12]
MPSLDAPEKAATAKPGGAETATAKALRLCFIGDSNLAALKLGHDGGIAEAAGVDISFYGAPGPDFRALRYSDGVIVPDPQAVEAVKLVTGGDRINFDAAEVDVVAFFAARFRVQAFFEEFLHRASVPGAFVSAQVRMRALEALAMSTRYVRAAFDMAARGHRVIFVPTPFLTDAIAGDPLAKAPMAAQATPDDRAALWDEIEGFFAARGVTLLRQPDETVVRGCLTDPAFAAIGAEAAGDAVHKSAEYGAMVIRQVLASLETAEISAK